MYRRFVHFWYWTTSRIVTSCSVILWGRKIITMASLLVSFCFRAVTTRCEKWDSNWFNSLRNSGIGINLTMASSPGQGVAAVTLPRFWTTREDPLRNCEKLIQMSKDWRETSNGWYDSEPRLHLKHQKKERILCLLSQSGFQKGKLWQLCVQPLLHGTLGRTGKPCTQLSTIRGRSKRTERNRNTKNLSHAAWEERVKQQVIADILSRAPHPQLSTANFSGEQMFLVELEAMALNNSGTVSKVTQENLQEQTSKDPALQS